MKTMQWDGTLHGANAMVAWVSRNRPDEDNPAMFVLGEHPHILLTIHDTMEYMRAGQYLLLEEYRHSIHHENPLLP